MPYSACFITPPALSPAVDSGYPFNAGQLEDGHRDLKCRKARPRRLRIQKPEALMVQSVPPYADTLDSSSQDARIYTWFPFLYPKTSFNWFILYPLCTDE